MCNVEQGIICLWCEVLHLKQREYLQGTQSHVCEQNNYCRSDGFLKLHWFICLLLFFCSCYKGHNQSIYLFILFMFLLLRPQWHYLFIYISIYIIYIHVTITTASPPNSECKTNHISLIEINFMHQYFPSIFHNLNFCKLEKCC